MSSPGTINIAESSTPSKRLATYDFTENSQLVSAQRIVLSDGDGGELKGQRTALESIPVVLASDQNQLPASLGQKAMVASFPVVLPSDQTVQMNVSQFGGVVVESVGFPTKTRQDFAEANRFFVGSLNPTIGTPVALNAAGATTFVATAPSLIINAPTRRVTLERLHLLVGAIGAGATHIDMVVVVDTANRYTSGGDLVTCRATTTQGAATATVRRAGTTAIVATAAGSSSLLVGRANIKAAAPVARDQYAIEFGNEQIVEGVFGTKITTRVAPVVIPAGGTCLIYLFSAGQTGAPTYEGIIQFTE